MGKFLTVIFVALHNIKSNPLHTILSTLGIVIGVAALVTILSLIDGLEHFIREDITQNVSMERITVQSRSTSSLDQIRVPLEDFPVITTEKSDSLKSILDDVESVNLRSSSSGAFTMAGSGLKAGARYAIVTEDGRNWDEEITAGAGYDEKSEGMIINPLLAAKFIGEEDPRELIGNHITLKEREFSVQGILYEDAFDEPFAILPFSLFDTDQLRNSAPTLMVIAENEEAVPAVRDEIEMWLNDTFDEGAAAFQIATNQQAFQQAWDGLQVFKIVMGMIMGIAILVGGVGVMNVLLISIKERTKEIGIRKATGAKKRDIILQFLSESIVISCFGTTLGLISGLLIGLAAVPVMGLFIDTMEFGIAFSFDSFLIIAILAVAIGLIFGTYPALKAANLTPVAAIRHE